MRILLGFALGFSLLFLGLWVGGAFAPNGGAEEPELPGPSAASQLTGTEVEAGGQRVRTGEDAPGRPGSGQGEGTERAPGASPKGVSTKPVRWRVLEAQTEAPLPGVRAFDDAGGVELGASDAGGLLSLRRWNPLGTVFFADGVWARTISERELAALAAASPGAELPLPMYADRYTQPVVLRFVAEGLDFAGRRLQLLITRTDGEPRHPRDFPTLRQGEGRRVPPELQRAWEQHLHLADALPLRGRYLNSLALPMHFEDAARCTLRFAHAGSFELRAILSGDDGHVGELRTRIGPETKELIVPMRPAASLRLVIRDPEGRPVASADVTAQHPRDQKRPTRRARADADGAARILGLFPGERLRITVRADGYEVKELTLSPGAAPHRIALVPLPKTTHRIQVIARGSSAPIEGARLSIGDPSRPASESKSDANGYTQLTLQRDATRVLTVRCEGYLSWRELLHVGDAALPSRVELIPSAREAQLEAGLITIVHGVVRDGAGRPIAGARVTLDVPSAPFGQPGATQARSILAGHQVPEQHLVQTDAKGRYELITARRGAAHVQHWSEPPRKRPVQLVPGKRVQVDFGAR